MLHTGDSFSLRRLFQLGQPAESPSERIMREAYERELAIDAQLGPPPTPPRMPRVNCSALQGDDCLWHAAALRCMHAVLNSEQAANVMQGIYLHGNVGSGKSMLMDLLLGAVSEAGIVPRVRRMHFNDAMDELNRRMYRLQREREQLDAKQNEAFLQTVAAHEHKNLVKSPTISSWCQFP